MPLHTAWWVLLALLPWHVHAPAQVAAGGPAPAAAARTPSQDEGLARAIVAFGATVVVPDGEVVRELPYVAQGAILVEQRWSDGTSLRKSYSLSAWRDAAGRTRGQLEWTRTTGNGSSIPMKMVTVWDPVEDAVLNWNEGAAARLVTMRHAAGNQAPAAAADPASESLPRETIAGLGADGTRVTRAISQGAPGSGRAVTVAIERWSSPDLRVTLKKVIEDPRFGRVTVAMTSVERKDPSPLLFRAPADVRVWEMTPPAPSIAGAARPAGLASASGAGSPRIRITSDVATAMLIRRVDPVSSAAPERSGPERSGTVRLEVIISPQGRVTELHPIGGPPVLAAVAVAAVRQWLFRPFLLNDTPVEVETTLDVVFRSPGR